MTLLEAISPTARALLKGAKSGGGIAMIAITKGSKAGGHRVHIRQADAPLCGGGHQAKSAQWQETIEEPDCFACLLIQKQRRTAATAKALEQQQEMIS